MCLPTYKGFSTSLFKQYFKWYTKYTTSQSLVLITMSIKLLSRIFYNSKTLIRCGGTHNIFEIFIQIPHNPPTAIY